MCKEKTKTTPKNNKDKQTKQTKKNEPQQNLNRKHFKISVREKQSITPTALSKKNPHTKTKNSSNKHLPHPQQSGI